MCRTLIGIAGVDMLSWGGANPQETLQGLLQVVSRLLQPDMGDSSSLYVGGLIHELLLKMPAQVQTCGLLCQPGFISRTLDRRPVCMYGTEYRVSGLSLC